MRDTNLILLVLDILVLVGGGAYWTRGPYGWGHGLNLIAAVLLILFGLDLAGVIDL